VPIDWTRVKNHSREWKRLLKVLGAPNLEASAPGAVETAPAKNSQTSTAHFSVSVPTDTLRSEMINSVGAPIQCFRLPQTIVELAVLLEWMLEQVNSLENVNHTFGGNRRIHANMWALWPKTIAAIHSCEGPSATERKRLIGFFENGPFSMFIREADYTLPTPDEKSYSRDRTHLKRDKYIVQGVLRNEIDQLIARDDLKSEFLTLMASPHSWLFRGFASEADYREYLHPTTKTLFKNLSPFQKEMLREVLERNEFEEEDLVKLGAKSGEVVETMNALIRDHWLEVVDFSARRFRLTQIGARLLKKQLSVD